MDKVKILHCSDLHFDSSFSELDKQICDKSKEELLEVFKKVIDIVIEKKVQILLIAGDVFDNITVSKSTLHFLCNQFLRIDKVKVFIAPGNHDPYNNKSFYRLIKWPDNVYVFSGELESIYIDELNLVIWGSGFKDKYIKESLFKNIEIDKEKINIMIMHGEICSENIKSNYNPIYKSDIYNSNIEYIALGHIHKFSGILREGNTYYSYSGCPQGRGFDEVGDKGVIIGDVFKNGVNLEFLNTFKRKYVSEKVDISNCYCYEDIKEKLINIFSEEIRKNNIFKITLNGEVSCSFDIDIKLLEEKLKDDFYYIKVLDNTNVYIDLEELSKDYSIKGEFVSLILKKIEECNSEEEKEIINLALKLGLKCLSDQEVNLVDN